MEATARLGLMEIFKEMALLKRRDERALQEDEFDRDLNKQKEFSDEKKRKAENEMLAATDQQLAAFQDRLDHYDTAVTDALMENERALDAVRKRRNQLEVSAQRLPDGRLAFKTNDGQRVFDQNGTALFRETVDPDTIPDSKPKWETFKTVREAEDKLLDERQTLHAFQSKIDVARERLSKDGVSKAELEALGADLQKDMPEGVKQRLGANTFLDNAASANKASATETVFTAGKTNLIGLRFDL